MKPTTRPVCRHGRSVLQSTLACALSVAAAPLGPTAWGQPARPAGAGAAAAAPAPPGVGLDSLSEQAVIGELADRGLTSLLNRAFEQAKIPPSERDGFAAFRAMRELSDKSRPLSNVNRIRLVRQSVSGLNNLLPRIDKVEDLMKYTGALIERGIEPDINTLEYWGENPVTQRQVKPAAETAIKMLEKVTVQAEAEATRLQATIKSPNDPAADQWVKMDALTGTSRYVRNMIAYYDALATDATTEPGKKARAQIADAAIRYLTGQKDPAAPGAAAALPAKADQPPPPEPVNLDTPESGVQALVHMRLGQLNWAKGDYEKARKYFQEMIDKKVGKKDIDPAPTVAQQFAARFFLVLTDISDKKPAEAAKSLAELKGLLPTAVAEIAALDAPAAVKKAQQGGAEASVQLAEYRVASLQADLSKSPAEKAKFDQKASDVLTQLAKDHPEFQAIITEQLVNRLPENVDMTKQSAPVLQALMNKGSVERSKGEKDPIDVKVLQRAADAAKEVATRKNVTPKQVEDAMLLRALFLERMGDAVGAANAFVDYAVKFTIGNKDTAGQAIDRAVGIAYELQKSDKGNQPAVKQLYGRALEVAVDPKTFNRKPYFYFYGNYLRGLNQQDKALPYYRAVPKGDPNEFNARFYAMLAMSEQLDKLSKGPDAQRKALMAEMSTVIDQVRAAGAATAKPTDAMRARLAVTTQVGADLALRQNDPQRALKLLDGYEQTLTGLPIAASMQKDASQIRANAYLAAGQLNKAVEEVQKLAQTDPGGTATLVRAVLDRLIKDRDVAKAAGQAAEVARISAAQADMTGYLVKWSSESKVKAIADLAPQYRLYDANMKRQAGADQTDPAEKKKQLTDALAAYEGIKAQGNLDVGTASNVNLGIGLAQFELGNYKAAHDTLYPLIAGSKLGTPQLYVTDKAGEARAKDNDAFWEANYKFLKSKVEIANANPSDPTAAEMLDSARQTVQAMYVTSRDETGGEKWHAEFEALRNQLAPGWTPGSIIPTTAPTTAPAATEPVAAGAGK